MLGGSLRWGVEKLWRVDGPSTILQKLKKLKCLEILNESIKKTLSLCEFDMSIELNFFGSLPTAGHRKLLLEGFLGDAKAVTLVPNVRAGVTIRTRAQQK
uniref:Uncharacterized protein n=1 Tax=Romanomermis culicivorax TaxID=13658 RepID=A0A915KUM5_ROMCU